MFQNSNQYASNIISLPDRNTAVAACGSRPEVDRAEQAAVQSGDGRASSGALLWRRVSQSAAIPAQQLLGLQEQLRRGSLALGTVPITITCSVLFSVSLRLLFQLLATVERRSQPEPGQSERHDRQALFQRARQSNLWPAA